MDSPEVHPSCLHRDGGTCEGGPDGTGPWVLPSPQFLLLCRTQSMSQKTRWVVVVGAADAAVVVVVVQPCLDDHRMGRGLPLWCRSLTVLKTKWYRLLATLLSYTKLISQVQLFFGGTTFLSQE